MNPDPTVQKLLAQQTAHHEHDRRLTWEEKVAIMARLRETFPGGRWPGMAAIFQPPPASQRQAKAAD